MGSFSIWHWIIVALVVLLVFGTKKLRGAGRDLGEAIKGFKQGMSDDDTPSARIEKRRTETVADGDRKRDRDDAAR